MYRAHHVALSVRNSVLVGDFYRKFGFESVALWKAEDSSLTITHFALGQFVLELFCYSDPTNTPRSLTLDGDLRVLGIKHFALNVEDIDLAAADVLAKSLAPSVDIRMGRTGIRYFFVQDPEANWLEIVEEKRDFWQK